MHETLSISLFFRYLEFEILLVILILKLFASSLQMSSQRGSGSEHHSSGLGKGKAVAYAPDSPLDTGKEYDAMETSRERADHDADDALPTPSPGIVIGEIARSFGTTHRTSGASTEVPSRSEPMPRRKTTSKRSRVTRVPPPTPT